MTPCIKTREDEFMFIDLHSELSELALVVSLDPELRKTVLECLRIAQLSLTVTRHVKWSDVFQTMIATFLRFQSTMSLEPITAITARLPAYLQPYHPKE